MNDLIISLSRVVKDLEELKTDFCLVGGFAVATHGYERTTKDIDLAISVAQDSESELLVRNLYNLGYEQHSVLEHEPTGRLATVRMVRNIDGQSTILDLLFASSGIESEIVAGAKLQEIIPGLKLRVAEVPHLVAMKLLSFDPFRRG